MILPLLLNFKVGGGVWKGMEITESRRMNSILAVCRGSSFLGEAAGFLSCAGGV